MTCVVCGQGSAEFGRATMLGRYPVRYFRCVACGFIQAREPYWLHEAYGEAIKRSDVGLVRRNSRLATVTGAVITAFFDRGARFLDYGGGYGLLARMMRDKGYDFYRWDKHCENLFVQDFEAGDTDQGSFALVTAFEVFEHLPAPLDDIGEMLRFSRNILFTTELVPDPPPSPDKWWYYGLEHGQHVSFYTRKSLAAIAERFSLNLCTNGRSLHLLTERPIPSWAFRALSWRPAAVVLNGICRRRSLIDTDYERIVRKNSGEGPRRP
ncbi:class I SAM-dependent methyltransferase [Geobacter sp.]|uniref:class I SAM-dependent methyltransferase n=1 Tax=Geobacter sp. TaxID=46610 RepID=UPI001AD2B6EC|nr:class I SAM-dependent methyltransferase [Geobacter sp.]CAG0933548.1 hypothetical protein RHDC3_02612 [Rhodocyclaceae bacterium]